MIPIVRIIGQSGSGKTTVIEKLVAELKTRGYKVATIKHSDRGFDVDQPGKDSYRHAQAGSDAAIISASDKVTITRKVDSDLSPGEISRFIGLDFDIIITEGFKQDRGPKIEVHRKEVSSDLIGDPEELMAIATNESLQLKVPQYAPEDAKGLTDLIEKTLLKENDEDSVSLYVNGEIVLLNQFVRSIFTNVLSGMVLSLKRVSKPDIIDISLRRKNKE